MRLSKYGITLNRLREDDIELVRHWRNSPQISRFMEFREHITPEMQQKWFESVNNFNNFYFIIEYQGEKIGVINSSKVDWDTVSSEGGIFLWEEQYYETFVPVWASLCLLESTFYVMGAFSSVIKTLKDNTRARQLVTSLGYKLMEGQEELYNQHYILTPESFRKHAPRLIQAASLLAGPEATQHRLFLDREDIETGLADFVDGKIRKETVMEYSETDEGRFYLFRPITA